MTLVAEIRAALTALGTFQHVSGSTVVPVKTFPAVIVEATEPTVVPQESGEPALTEMRFEVSVIVMFDGNTVTEDTYDRALDQLEDLVNSVRTVLWQLNRGVKYSGELITGVDIDNRRCLLWQFDSTLIFD